MSTLRNKVNDLLARLQEHKQVVLYEGITPCREVNYGDPDAELIFAFSLGRCRDFVWSGMERTSYISFTNGVPETESHQGGTQ